MTARRTTKVLTVIAISALILASLVIILSVSRGLTAALTGNNNQTTGSQFVTSADQVSAGAGGGVAPEFQLRTLDGKTSTLSMYKGDVVVLDFWATWCIPCRHSLPHIQKLVIDPQRRADGLHVLTVNASDTRDQISEFVAQNKFTFTVLMDSDHRISNAYGVYGIPQTVIIGRDGLIKALFTGFRGEASARAIDQAIDRALIEKKPT